MALGFSKVSIYNMALGHIGSKSTVEDVGEENRPAKVLTLWYDAARLLTLEVFNWQFARKCQTLATHSEAAPTNRWAYRYQYPSTCVKARMIENPLGDDADAIAFQVEVAGDPPNETKSILTDQEDAALIFTYDLTDVAQFSMHFVLMHSVQLGMLANTELSGKANRMDKMIREWNRLLLAAPAVDAEESVPKKQRDAPWHRART